MENYVTSTGYAIAKRSISEDGVLRLKSFLSVLDFHTKGEIPKAFFEMGEYIGVPRMPKNILERIVGKQLQFKVIKEEPESVKPFAYNLKATPMQHQVHLLNECYKYLDDPTHPFDFGKRLCITLGAGFGKTFMAADIINHLKTKFVFIVNSGEVAKQAHRELTRLLNPRKDTFLYVTSSQELKYPPKNITGIFMTHAMFRSAVKTLGLEHMRNLFMNELKIGMKVLDEFDMEVMNMYYIDTMFNFKYNLYLTATKFKSLLPDDKIYQTVYGRVMTVGKDTKLEPRKDIHLIQFKSSPTPGEFFKATQREETFKIHYNNFLAKKDVIFDFIMDTYYTPSNSLFKTIISEGGQVGFFCGRIENCQEVKQKLMQRYNIPEDDIGILNTSISGEAARSRAKEKPFLITITMSFGRGVDSPILRCLVYLEFTFSRSQLIQSIARVGRIGKGYGHVIYPVDFSFSKVKNNYDKLKNERFFYEHFKQIQFKTIPEEYYRNYIYGYRRDSLIGIELSKKEKKKMEAKLKISKLL
ncbi:MAG: DEAD/DEAH box helicase [Peptostreptococcaceae bacterium]